MNAQANHTKKLTRLTFTLRRTLIFITGNRNAKQYAYIFKACLFCHQDGSSKRLDRNKV